MKRRSSIEVPNGNGNFGRWSDDRLPFYRYTGADSEHLHAFGNWRATVVADGEGWVRVFAPERGPCFLQREGNGGGAVTVRTGKTVLSTVGSDVEIEFGALWLRKRVRRGGLRMNQRLFMPDGDDPVVISLVTIESDEPVEVTVEEVWGFHPVLMPLLVPRSVRRHLGFLDRWSFRREGCRVEASRWSARRKPDCRSRLGYLPDKVALIALSREPEALAAESRRLVLRTALRLDGGESVEHAVAFAWGNPAEIEACYFGRAAEAWENSRAAWEARAPRFEIPGHSWAARETAWSGAQLAAATIRDDYYEGHRVTQGGNYLFVNGLDAAPRDLCQHAIAALHVEPWLALETVRTVCRIQRPDGGLPWDLSGYGCRDVIPAWPSDQDLWLLWAAAETFLAKRDRAALEERLPFHPREAGECDSLREHLAVAFRHFRDSVGFGPHGLPRLRYGDWNDEILFVNPAPLSPLRTIRSGESTFNAALAAYALRRYAELLRWMDQDTNEVEALLDRVEKGLHGAFTGRWFNRAWVGKSVEMGRDELCLEPQTYALIAGILNDSDARNLIGHIDGILRSRSPIGAAVSSAPPHGRSSAPGTLENGGVWFAVSGPLVMGLARYDRDMAFEEWVKSSLARHADVYPDTWFGIWSAPDSFNSFLAEKPGDTWVGVVPLLGWRVLAARDWPVMNAHAHAWPLAAGAYLAGFSTDALGYRFEPRLPDPILRKGFAWRGAPWSYCHGPDEISGHVNPTGEENLRILVARPADWKSAAAEIDGRPTEIEIGKSSFELRARGGSFRIRRSDVPPGQPDPR